MTRGLGTAGISVTGAGFRRATLGISGLLVKGGLTAIVAIGRSLSGVGTGIGITWLVGRGDSSGAITGISTLVGELSGTRAVVSVTITVSPELD